MIHRALIVLLVVINLGVAAWWASRTPATPETRIDMPQGVPRLQLLQENPAAMRATQVPAASTIARAEAQGPVQCLSFGPYTNPALLRRAHERLQSQVVVARVREVLVGTPRAWRVFVPPFPSRADSR